MCYLPLKESALQVRMALLLFGSVVRLADVSLYACVEVILPAIAMCVPAVWRLPVRLMILCFPGELCIG